MTDTNTSIVTENAIETVNGYPAKPIWDDYMKFKRGVIPALMKFKQECPYSAGVEKRKEGLMELLEEFETVYGMAAPILEFTEPEKNYSYESHYIPEEHKIVMVGKLSIITFLHEFAHSQGKDEVSAVKWSLSLFKRCFPRAFVKLVANAHMMVSPETQEVVNA